MRTSAERATFEKRVAAQLAGVPATGGFRLDPVSNATMVPASYAQDCFIAAMAMTMTEWHGRGTIEGRMRERERITQILHDKAALGRRDLALSLALTTDDTVEQVLAVLKAAPRDIVL